MHALFEHTPLHEQVPIRDAHHVDKGGVGFGAMSEDFWEANACALIVCSNCVFLL